MQMPKMSATIKARDLPREKQAWEFIQGQYIRLVLKNKQIFLNFNKITC